MQTHDLDVLIDEIIRRADENRSVVGGPPLEQIRAIKTILMCSDVVFGVYPTDRTEAGFQFIVLKGSAALDAARTTGERPAWDAIPCRSCSEAEAIERVLGDLARDVWRSRPRGGRLRLPSPPETVAAAPIAADQVSPATAVMIASPAK